MMRIETYHFNRTRVGENIQVSDEEIDFVRDPQFLREYTLRFRASIWERFLERVVIHHPATWWDAFKLRFFPGWWLRRWPAKQKTIELEALEVAKKLALPPGHSVLVYTVCKLDDSIPISEVRT